MALNDGYMRTSGRAERGPQSAVSGLDYAGCLRRMKCQPWHYKGLRPLLASFLRGALRAH